MSGIAAFLNRADVQRARVLLEGWSDTPLREQEQLPEPRPGDVTRIALLHRLAYYAGLTRSHALFVAARAGTVCVLLVAVSLFLRNVFVLLLLPEVILLEIGALQRRVFQRAESFERDYTAMLLALASSVRTGLDPVLALCDLQRLFHRECELYRQLVLFKKHIDGGMQEAQAIQKFAVDVQHPDLPLFRTAFILARKEGSSLGVCLERLARVTRSRQSFRRKMRAAVAMQKLSAIGIVCCCAAIAVIQFFANPDGFMQATQHPLGRRIMGGGIALLACGTIWMLRIARMRI